MKCRSASWNNFGVMKCISASWNDFGSVMSSNSASWKFIGVMKWFYRRHELKSGVMKFFRRHETTFSRHETFSPSWINFRRHENNFSPGMPLCFAGYESSVRRHQSAHVVSSQHGMTGKKSTPHDDVQVFIKFYSFMFTCGTPFCTPHHHHREHSSHRL